MIVLVVEDEEDIRTIVRMSLQQLGGLTVIDTASGAEALAVTKRVKPDVVLLDVMMPDMDGPAVLQALRADAETAAVPIIFLTAKAMPAELERLRALGALAIFTKPFDPVALPSLVRQALEGRAPSAEPHSPAGSGHVPDGRDPAALDGRALRRLLGLTGDSGGDLIGELIALFETTTRETLGQLRRVGSTGDAPLGARLGHSLKGSAGTLGATRITTEAETIERLCREGRTSEVEPHVARIAEALEATMAALRAERAKLLGTQ